MTTTTQPTAKGIGGPDREQAELLDVSQVAALLNCSKRTVYRLADSGRMPRPLKLGSLVRWRAGEVRQWIADGCPKCRVVRGGGR
jgi:excisionase family DNA binding protein